MKECDNSKIHINSNFLLSVRLLIILDTLLLGPSLHCNILYTSSHFTQLHLSTLHLLLFTLHYPLIWLNLFTFPTVLFHLTSLNQTQCQFIQQKVYFAALFAISSILILGTVTLFIHIVIFIIFAYFSMYYICGQLFHVFSACSLAVSVIDFWLLCQQVSNKEFLISSFRRVQNIVCFLLCNSPASDLYMPTFRNTLSVPV